MRDRKLEHIQLTNKSQTSIAQIDPRFNYEPLLSAHPTGSDKMPTQFLGKELSFPIWISSMTGGTGVAGHINQNLSRLAGEFGFAMGLGSCRMLLESDEFLADFALRDNVKEMPFWANLGIAQLEQLIMNNELDKVDRLVSKTSVDGLIVHLNPMQEWFQPEGDIISRPPLDTIRSFLELRDIPIIVKEVGQGIGPQSLSELMKLPIAAIEFAAFGGTNFSQLEKHRNSSDLDLHVGLINVGHSALEMVEITNKIIDQLKDQCLCKNFIISGGVRSYLDGYYLVKKSKGNAVFGMASPFLEHANNGYQQLHNYALEITKGLAMANSFLSVKE